MKKAKNESENTEYKRTVTDDIYKSVIAFANTNGGTVYVGVDDNGETVGIEDIDDVYTRITNTICDIIAPNVTMFTKYTLHDKCEVLKVYTLSKQKEANGITEN